MIPQTVYPDLPLKNIAPKGTLHFKWKLMSLPELTTDKITHLQERIQSAKNYSPALQPTWQVFHRHHGSLIQESHWLQQHILICSSTKILIKYLLHASHDSLGHVGTTECFQFIKRLYYLPDVRKIIHKYVEPAKNAKSWINKN